MNVDLSELLAVPENHFFHDQALFLGNIQYSTKMEIPCALFDPR